MLPWDDLRLFLAIARAGNLTAAAAQVGVNQSTMSRRLAALEEEAGQPLVERTPAGYVCTPAGERVVRAVERMEGEALALARDLGHGPVGLEGVVRVSAPEALGSHFLAVRLSGLKAAHPGLAIELVTDERPSLGRRDADLGLTLGLPSEPDLFVRKLGDIAYAAYVAETYVGEHGRPDPGEDGGGLSGHAAIGYTDEQGELPEAAWFARLARGARPILRTSAVLGQLEAVRAGIGIAALPCFLGDREQGLLRLTDPGVGPRREIWLGVHRDLRHAPRLRAAIDFLSGLMRRERGLLTGIASNT
jgi:DNA-binding transcriptional LysR family regulator